MIVTAWSNGKSGFGFKLSASDRDQFFSRKWSEIMLTLPGKSSSFAINIDKPSFWNETCRELIAKEIGAWLKMSGYAPWAKGCPPKFELIQVKENLFKLAHSAT
jgi:hypothetical protein